MGSENNHSSFDDDDHHHNHENSNVGDDNDATDDEAHFDFCVDENEKRDLFENEYQRIKEKKRK